jgi:predicted MFS family arabinose efflux permease
MTTETPASRMSGVAMFFSVFLPFAFGHYLSLLLRNMNSVLAPNLVSSLGLDSGQLGLLTSAFFFTYALVQLPVGIALDHYGPRKVQLLLMTSAAAGALLFARGDSFAELVAARALIGLGLGGCFMSAVKVISSWIAPAKVPSVHGYLIAVGGLGSATATLPVRAALQLTDWRGLFVLLALLMAVAGVAIWMVAPREAPRRAALPTIKSVLDVYRNPQFRKTVSLMLIPHAVFFGMQGLWIGRWLAQVAHFSDDAVAYLLYLSMAAVIFGAIAVGLGTERAAKRGILPLDMAAVGIAAFLLVQGAMVFNYAPSYQLLAVLFTLVGTITGMEYAIIAQSLPRELTGRASTCVNLLIFVGAFLVQAGFGQILGLWHPDFLGRYPVIAYRVGFAVLVLLQAPGLVMYALRRRHPQRAISENILVA